MNRLSIYRFPERLKRLYLKYFPSSSPISYGQLLSAIETLITSQLVNEEDEIPGGDINE